MPSSTFQALGVEARLVGRDQAVDDLLVVAELVVGVLGDLDDGFRAAGSGRRGTGPRPSSRRRLELGVGVVVLGQGLEGRLHRPRSRWRARACRRRRSRADAALGRGHDRLLGVDGAGQLDELPGLAQLDHLGHLEERRPCRVGLAVRRRRRRSPRSRRGPGPSRARVPASAGITWGIMPSNRFQTVLVFQPVEALLQGLDLPRPACPRAAATCSISPLGTPSAASSSGVAITVSSRAEVAGDQGLDQDLRGLLGRDPLPADDLAPLDQPRPRAAGVQPAALVEAAVAVEVDLAVDLEAVLVVAPLVQVLAAVGVDEPAEELALAVAERIADGPLLGVGDESRPCRRRSPPRRRGYRNRPRTGSAGTSAGLSGCSPPPCPRVVIHPNSQQTATEYRRLRMSHSFILNSSRTTCPATDEGRTGSAVNLSRESESGP